MAAFVLIVHSMAMAMAMAMAKAMAMAMAMAKAMAVDLTHHHRLNRKELLGALIVHLAVLKERRDAWGDDIDEDE